MHCFICGGDNAYIEYKRGKGKLDVKKAIVGAVLSAPIGGVGLAAGFTDMIASKGYCCCPDCGYDQYAHYSSGNVLNVNKLQPLDMQFDDYGIDYKSLSDKLLRFARSGKTPTPLFVRYVELPIDAPVGANFIPCILLEHPEHTRDYFSYCIAPINPDDSERRYAVFLYGNSVRLNRYNYNQDASAINGAGLGVAGIGAIRGGSRGAGEVLGGLGFELGHATTVGLKKFVNAVTMDRNANAQELAWYDEIEVIIKCCFY